MGGAARASRGRGRDISPRTLCPASHSYRGGEILESPPGHLSPPPCRPVAPVFFPWGARWVPTHEGRVEVDRSYICLGMGLVRIVRTE